MTSPLLAPIPGHLVMVTPGPVGRAFLDCSCGFETRFASMRAAERAGLRHYIAHAPHGPDRDRAINLLNPTEGDPS